MPIWVMGGANTTLSTEGAVLKGADMSDMWPSYKFESIGIAIYMVWMELDELVSGVRIAVQQ